MTRKRKRPAFRLRRAVARVALCGGPGWTLECWHTVLGDGGKMRRCVRCVELERIEGVT